MNSIPTNISSRIEITRVTRDLNETSVDPGIGGGGGLTFTSSSPTPAAAPSAAPGGGDVVVQIDGEVLGRVALKKVREAAQGSAY